jgi:copper(I)-binding protein
MRSFRAAVTALPIAVIVLPACAHVVLSQSRFEAGQNYAAFFKVEHGCDGSPTIALTVRIPAGVTVLDMPGKPGWALHAQRGNGRIESVSWRGKLDAKTADQFGLFLKLPANAGALYFPALQQCAKGETRWDDIPAAGQTARDVSHPAPVLQLTAATTPPSYMAGNIMIEQVWSPATPNGAATGAAYLTVMNHGSAPDTLTGGSSPVAGKIEVHQMSSANGVMSMRLAAGGIEIPAGATVTLGPQANYHLMLTGLKAPLVRGAHVPATLNFAKAGPVQVELAVAPIGARAPAPMSGMDHR